jgi:alpha-L-rhamnosidase
MAKIADVIDKKIDKKYFRDLAEKIKNAYNTRFFNPSTRNYNDGSQMANAFPLVLGIVPNKYQQDVLNNLVNDILNKHEGHLTTGVLGSKYVIDALTQYERSDIAWKLATQTGYPSWADMVEKYTTMCEFWTLKQSHNHVMMGSIDAWFYKTLAGINLDEEHPAYENIIFKPFLAKDLSFVKASIETCRGTVSSEWELNESQLKLNIHVPFNTSADIYIPVHENAKVFEGGISVTEVDGINLHGNVKNYQVYSVDSGNYEFVVMQ